MSSEEATLKNVVDERYPDLIVSHFARNGCSLEVPVAVVQLMESFYSMWKKRRLSSSELQSIKSLTNGHTVKMDLFRMKVKGGVIHISMVAEGGGDAVLMCFEATLPPKVKYIAGHFGRSAFGSNRCKASWKRLNNQHPSFLYQHIPRSDIKSYTELAVSCYFRITQIKYAEEAKMEDFDVTRTQSFKQQGQFQWVIEGEELKELQMDSIRRFQRFIKASTIRDGWKFKLFHDTLGRGIKTFDLAPEHPFLPLDVGGYTMKFIVRYQDKVMQSDCTYKTSIMQQRGQMAFPSYSSLMLAVFDIKGKSRIELDVEWKVTKLYDMDGKTTLYTTQITNKSTEARVVQTEQSSLSKIFLLLLLTSLVTVRMAIAAASLNTKAVRSVKDCVSMIQRCKFLRDLEVIALSVENDSILSTNLFVKTALLNRFSNHSLTISKCVSVFNSIPDDGKDLVITCSMMNAFIKHNQSINALLLFDSVKNSPLLIGHDDHKLSYFYSLGIKACIRCNDHSKGLEMHSLLKHHHPMLYQNHFINTSLITFYSHFGDVQSAVTVFHDAIHFNVASLNALITALIDHHQYLNAMRIYNDLESEHGTKYDDITHLLALKLCINTNDHDRGQQIIRKLNHYDHCSVEMRNTLIEFHGHFNTVHKAMDIFHGMDDSLKSKVTMTVILKAMMNNNLHSKALDIYGDDRYQHLLCTPSHILALKSCIILDRYDYGLEVITKHKDVFRRDFKNKSFIKNTMIDFYGHFGLVQDAMDIFASISKDEMVGVNVSCIMKALINNECYESALRVYDEYQSEGMDHVEYDNVTHVLALKALKNTNDWERGKRVHSEGLNPYLLLPPNDALNERDGINGVYSNSNPNRQRLNRYDFNVVVSSLIDFYGHFGDIETSMNLFRTHFIHQNQAKRQKMNLCAVNAMLNVYLENELYAECIHLFQIVHHRIDRWRVKDRDAVNFDDVKILYSTAIKCCTEGLMIECGLSIHEMLKMEKEDKSTLIGDIWKSALIQINLVNMYAKFGMIGDCERVFIECLKMGHWRNIKVWNTIIYAFGMNGYLEKAKVIFSKIAKRKEIMADEKTYVLIINACCHCGDVEHALKIWKDQISNDQVRFSPHIVSNLAQCLSQQGQIEEAKQIIERHKEFDDQSNQ